MLNSVHGALVKHLNMKTLSQNVYIQHFENIKSYFHNNKFLFYFFFGYAKQVPKHDPINNIFKYIIDCILYLFIQ
jgi:hypothetical protein